MVHSEKEILQFLNAGNRIRRMDGRAGNNLVSLATLEAMIQQKMVRVIKIEGMDFVVSKTIRRHR